MTTPPPETVVSFEQLDVKARRQAAADLQAQTSKTHQVSIRLHQGDARDLEWLPDESVHLVVTSPP